MTIITAHCRCILQSVASLILLLLFVQVGAAQPPDTCSGCHADRSKMLRFGFPHLSVTAEEATRQSGMNAACSDCHLGDPTNPDRTAAHRGMGRLLLVRKKGMLAESVQREAPLKLTGNPMTRIQHQIVRDGKVVIDPNVTLILYQDKRRDNLSQDFGVMEKTCGACHAKEFSEFTQSTMGRNAKQSRYQSWTDQQRGPHNCGAWFNGNYERISTNTAVPFSRGQSALNQRSCNTCHVGCLDCHYDPQPTDPANPKQGIHTFNRVPKPESCYGGGRGQICHAGPEERRRGAGYFGGSYANPEGMEPDIHQVKKIGCLDCHENSGSKSGLGHGMIKRQGRCDRCHERQVASHKLTLHKTLSCEACHIQNISGYQGTFWGPGKLAGSNTPFFKYKEYYGIMKEPILIRDQNGRWIPVKPFPMAVLNQKESALKPGLHWRWPKELPDLQRTDDAYGYVGLFDGLPENNRALAWIQMDKVSHKYGKSRPCASCHELPDGEQRQHVEWDFTDAGALPFSGSHVVVAGKKGLSIRDMKSEKIDVLDGYRLSSLAPWFYLKDRWHIEGDFSLPSIKERELYSRAKGDVAKARQARVVH
ncbi:cytochrome c3 family protein [Geobacter grbiciae]|uniref:cytochrome c3 family protein n=1 Tax=Geobacter grbiciae TaxID=155042 RepID=UPI001C0278D1|nr:cytochrome c3 family protein [Geobacter grbiciae]MBT1073764.1 cytochrome C [Geobacter grbiciae]